MSEAPRPGLQRRFRAFHAVQRLSTAGSRRFTAAGRLLALLFLGAAIFGADPRETQAYRLAAFLAGCFVVAAVGVRRTRPRVLVRRELPALVTAHEAAGYYLCVTNTGAATAHALLLHDELASAPTAPLAAARSATDGGADNWFDRRVGFLRWLAALRRARGAALEPVVVPTLRPGATLRLFVPITPLRRGRLEFAAVVVAQSEPLGLLRGLVRLPLAEALVAVPRRHPVPALPGVADPRLHGAQRLVRSTGSGEEFFGLRDYRPGDPERHLHWRSFAKRGSPVVKQFADRFRDRITVVVDCHQPVADETTFEALLAVAGSIATRPRAADCELEVLVAGESTSALRAGAGLGLLATLACLQSVRHDTHQAIAARLTRDAVGACFVVTSTWDASRAPTYGRLAARVPGLRVLLVGAPVTAAPATWLVAIDPAQVAAGLTHLAGAPDARAA
ncbi:MAG: DUF58 domain-containing protein [Gammaproteobacteria bacterium]|nr:DUF58 domain-containing protein [Gammaproteobacteria bacterium]